MAQFIFFNWQDDDSTKDLNSRLLGINDAGRYRGFDVDLATPGGLTLRLQHAITGFPVTLFDDPTFTIEVRGVLLSKQGVIIHENAPIDIPINAGDATHARIDLIVAEHIYENVQDGSECIYYVIQGTPSANPVAPVVPAPLQIKLVLGQLYVPANMAALTDAGVVYTQAAQPSFSGDNTIMHTNLLQASTARKRFSSVLTTSFQANLAQIGGLNYNVDLQGVDGNSFVIPTATAANYLNVINFINRGYTGEGYRFKVWTQQRLIFTPSANIATIDNGPCFVEPGEELEIWDLNALLGIIAATPYYFVAKGGIAYTSSNNKYRMVQSWNYGGAIAINAGSRLLTLNKQGNLYYATGATGQNLDGISDHNTKAFTITPISEFGGTLLFLKISSTPANNFIFVRHNQTVGSGFKPIYTPTAATVKVNDQGLLALMEFPDHYEIVSVIDSDLNLWDITASVEQVVTDLGSEINNRTIADTTLQNNINAEAATRASAVTTLQTNINSEATTRANADSSEATARANADTTLQNNINAEAAARTAADNAITAAPAWTNITTFVNGWGNLTGNLRICKNSLGIIFMIGRLINASSANNGSTAFQIPAGFGAGDFVGKMISAQNGNGGDIEIPAGTGAYAVINVPTWTSGSVIIDINISYPSW